MKTIGRPTSTMMISPASRGDGISETNEESRSRLPDGDRSHTNVMREGMDEAWVARTLTVLPVVAHSRGPCADVGAQGFASPWASSPWLGQAGRARAAARQWTMGFRPPPGSAPALCSVQLLPPGRGFRQLLTESTCGDRRRRPRRAKRTQGSGHPTGGTSQAALAQQVRAPGAIMMSSAAFRALRPPTASGRDGRASQAPSHEE